MGLFIDWSYGFEFTHKKPMKKVIYFIYGPHSYNYNNNVTLSKLCDKDFAEKTSYPTYDSVNAAVNREGITTQTLSSNSDRLCPLMWRRSTIQRTRGWERRSAISDRCFCFSAYSRMWHESSCSRMLSSGTLSRISLMKMYFYGIDSVP